MTTVLVLMLENPDTTFESNLTAQVCVSVVSGVLQSGLEVVVTLDTIPSNPEGHEHMNTPSTYI